MNCVFYDLSNLYYSSFYVTGFMEAAKECGFLFRVSHSIPSILNEEDVLNRRELLFSVLLFRIEMDNDEFYFAVDTLDGYDADSYHLPLLKRCRYYFKVNCRRDALCSVPEWSREDEVLYDRIIPIPPFFPIRPESSGNLWPRFLPSRAANWGPMDVLKRFKAMGNIPVLDEIRKLREMPKRLDVFFIMTYYGKERHSDAVQLRYEIMRNLQKQSRLDIEVGFIARCELPDHMRDLHVPVLPFRKYLARLAQSRVGIYVRGLHECHSFKMTEQLALGLPVVGQRIRNNDEDLMGQAHFGEQYCFEDAEEIIENVVCLLQDRERIERLSEGNRKTFDRCFTPIAVARDIFQRLV